MRVPEHMRGFEILKMDAVSWLQASNESLAMWQPPRCAFLFATASQPAGSGVASLETLSEITQRQQGQHGCGGPDVSLLEKDQGRSGEGRLDAPAGGRAEGRQLDQHAKIWSSEWWFFFFLAPCSWEHKLNHQFLSEAPQFHVFKKRSFPAPSWTVKAQMFLTDKAAFVHHFKILNPCQEMICSM